MKSHFVIHHSLTKDSGTVTWGAIRDWHVGVFGWKAIGYHFGVEMVFDHYEMMVGRPVTFSAAAAYQRGMNHRGIHVCFVGNYDDAAPAAEMLEFAAPHLAAVCDLAGIDIDREHVIGHRDVASYKSCPGRLFDMDEFVLRLQGEG